MVKTLQWIDGFLVMIDQTRLPDETVYLRLSTYQEAAHAIRSMQVRGAPAIGVTAALGMALGARACSPTMPRLEFDKQMQAVGKELAGTRPTAVNLFWAIDRMLSLLTAHPDQNTAQIQDLMTETAVGMIEEDIAMNRALGFHGSALAPEDATILTHCNAGALACAGFGTALGVVRAAVEEGKRIRVIADETRPRLQGAQLTCWELREDGIPVTLIPDSAAGSLMRQGKVDLVVVGADRIAANGDTANKIGTYPLAVLARENGVPFYVAAPTSTIDLSLPDGESIPIEQRAAAEVTGIGPARIGPEGIEALNPAFDVTPARYVNAIITEKGVARPEYRESLAALCKHKTSDQRQRASSE